MVVGASPFSLPVVRLPSHRESTLDNYTQAGQVGSHLKQGLQKYFSVQDSCGECSSESQPHFDLWMGVPSYSNEAQLSTCADGITVSDPTAAVIINPNDGYYVDPTPLMSSTGTCDTNADYSRTQPVPAGGGGGSGSPTTLSTVASSAMPSASAGTGAGSKTSSDARVDDWSGYCSWVGHCRGATCQSDNDCADPFSCVNDICA